MPTLPPIIKPLNLNAFKKSSSVKSVMEPSKEFSNDIPPPQEDKDNLKALYWFKWDSSEVYKADMLTKQWVLRSDVKVTQKFLFFSSVLHLPQD